MKQTGCAITFLSFFIMAFGACASRPDEVVTILERADCGLLLTQALDRKTSPASVNSSIAFAVDYFEKNSDKQARCRALHLEKEKAQIEMGNRILQLGTIVMSVLFLGVACYFYNRYGHAKLKIEQIGKTVKKGNRRIVVFLNDICRYRQPNDERVKEMYAKIKDLTYQINRLTKENVELRSKIGVSELIKILKNGTAITEKLTSKEWDKIFNLVNCLHLDLLIRLKEEHTQLTKRDIELLALILLGFTSKELMAVFDSKDIHTIFKAKSRLKERLKLKKEESLDEFLQKVQEI